MAATASKQVYDVVIAGAGPVGLFLACELSRAKLSVRVLEMSEELQSPLKRLPFGLRGLWGPSVEALYRRGLLERVAAPPRPHDPKAVAGPLRPGSIAAGGQRSGPAGHFAGLTFEHGRIDSSRWPFRLPGPGAEQLGAEQEHLETVLADEATALGVEVERGVGVDGFDASDEEVVVHSGVRSVRARWLVGCDGGRSAVRKLGGFDFVGTEPLFTPAYSVHVDVAEPEKLCMGRQTTATGQYTQWQPGVIGMVDFDGGAPSTVGRPRWSACSRSCAACPAPTCR